jgi:SAM-dependent methyltransferase
MFDTLSDDELRAKADSFGRWYHEIELRSGVNTRSLPHHGIWGMIEQVLSNLDYKDKSVLDLGTMDGKWAFFAEQAGAEWVVAGDVWDNPRLKFAKDVLGSKVFPFANADVHCLYHQLVEFCGLKKFDIIQNMGVMYHVQNPMLAFHQIRRCIKDTGIMVLETGLWLGCLDEPAARLNRGDMIYPDETTYWMMNRKCLEEILTICGWQIQKGTVHDQTQSEKSERFCCVCRPIQNSGLPYDFGASDLCLPQLPQPILT